MKNKIINTRKQAEENPMLQLLQALAGGVEGAVEREEKAGQQQAVVSDVLPSKGLDKYMPGGPYAGLGFIIGEHVERDDMWRYVQLPAGWTKKATSHSMHNNILDERGRKRASFFYKAAFYDRDAIMYPPISRYEVTIASDHELHADGSVISYDVLDNAQCAPYTDKYGSTYPRGKVLNNFKGEWKKGDKQDRWKLQDAIQAKAKAWTEEQFPDFENPLTYWD
jgi:hypothetical protein